MWFTVWTTFYVTERFSKVEREPDGENNYMSVPRGRAKKGRGIIQN